MFSLPQFLPKDPPPYQEAMSLPEGKKSPISPPPKYCSPEKLQQTPRGFEIVKNPRPLPKSLQLPYNNQVNGVSQGDLKRYKTEQYRRENLEEAKTSTNVSRKVTQLKPFSN